VVWATGSSSVTARCTDDQDIVLSGSCPSGNGGSIILLSFRVETGGTSNAGFTCSYQNTTGFNNSSAGAYCLAL
jgi:hypothetical protein